MSEFIVILTLIFHFTHMAVTERLILSLKRDHLSFLYEQKILQGKQKHVLFVGTDRQLRLIGMFLSRKNLPEGFVEKNLFKLKVMRASTVLAPIFWIIYFITIFNLD